MHRYSVGDRVSQAQYGPGTVTMMNERHTIVQFDDHGTRTFVTGIVQLEPSDTEKPVKPVRAKRVRQSAPKSGA